MKSRWIVSLAIVLAFALATVALAGGGKGPQAQRRTHNGTCLMDGSCGTCPNASLGNMADDDGDGIPNCQDPDYTPPQDGTGKKHGKR